MLGSLMPQTTTLAVPIGGDRSGPTALSSKVHVDSYSANRPGGFAYGTSPDLLWPYTTSRVASSTANATNLVQDNPVSSTPYRQTGLLLAAFSDGIAQCTASLIRPNVIVTAAHCVEHFGTGSQGMISGAIWIPANTGDPYLVQSPGPFGVWEVANVIVPASYYNGTDTCRKGAPGIACNNDLAVLSLLPLNGQKAGAVLGGTYSYSANGYSFIKSKIFKNSTIADITQLGYPADYDDGFQMQRNNSFGRYTVSKQTTSKKAHYSIEFGSALAQGASGGPVLVNFGTTPSVGGSSSLGVDSVGNVMVGVSSYAYFGVSVNVDGATFFGQNAEFPADDYGGYGPGNIGSLVHDICNLDPSACVD